MEDTTMRKNLASLTAALAAAVLLFGAANSWACEAPVPLPQAAPAATAAPAGQAAPAPIHLAWDRVGITASGFGA
jgi:hypothetical protein